MGSKEPQWFYSDIKNVLSKTIPVYIDNSYTTLYPTQEYYTLHKIANLSTSLVFTQQNM